MAQNGLPGLLFTIPGDVAPGRVQWPSVSLVASGKIAPSLLVEALVSMDLSKINEEPYGPLVLVVSAPSDDSDGAFMKRLVDCVLKEGPPTPTAIAWPSTAEFPTMRLEKREGVDADHIALLSELASAPHCVVPLRETTLGRSFSIGRSSKSDIVLSDPSVSNHHALITVRGGGVKLTDSGSKNGTTHNSLRLNSLDAPWLQPMDRISFGRVKAFTCDPRALRGVLRQELKTMF